MRTLTAKGLGLSKWESWFSHEGSVSIAILIYSGTITRVGYWLFLTLSVYSVNTDLVPLPQGLQSRYLQWISRRSSTKRLEKRLRSSQLGVTPMVPRLLLVGGSCQTLRQVEPSALRRPRLSDPARRTLRRPPCCRTQRQLLAKGVYLEPPAKFFQQGLIQRAPHRHHFVRLWKSATWTPNWPRSCRRS